MTSPANGAPFAVRAPATSANLGPGFDCLGVALDLWNQVEVQLCEQADATVVALEGPDSPLPSLDLVLIAARRLAQQVEQPLPPLRLRTRTRIPLGRGLGSSAAAIASGLLLANRLLGEPLTMPQLLDLACVIEGHPDNVVPCLLGGARVAVRDEQQGLSEASIPLALDLHVALFVPDTLVPTELARAALPTTVPLADALFNVGRTSLLVAALAAGRADLLREATRDRLHQPHRSPLFPPGPRLMKEALRAGALGAFVSGAGPTILAFCADPPTAETVARRMAEAAERDGVRGDHLTLSLSQQGAHIAAPDPPHRRA